VAVVGLNALGQMFFIPAYPFWSLLIIAVDVVALWGLCLYGSRANIEAASYRGGIVLLGSSALFPLGVALLVTGLMLEAGATGAVKAIKVSAKLLAGRSPDTPDNQAPSGLDGAGPSSAPDSLAG